MLTILNRIVLYWRTSLKVLSFGSIACLPADHNFQFTINRVDKPILTLIAIGAGAFSFSGE